MAVEYGVGITNRFSFLPEDSEGEETKTEDRKTRQVTESKSKKEEICKDLKNPPKRGTKGKDVGGEVRQVKNAMVGANKGNNDGKMNSMAVAVEKAGARESRDGGGMGRNYTRQGPGQQTFPNRIHKDGRGDAPGNQQRGNPRRRQIERPEEKGKERQVENRNRDEGIAEPKDNAGDVNTDDVDIASKENENEDKVLEAEAAEKTLTLGEWKASQTPREMPVFNIRRPGEGEDFGRLGKLIPKKKEDEIARDAEDDYEVDEAYYPQRAGKFKQISDVGFTTGYQKRRGGGRFSNGRGGRFGGNDARDSSSDENVVTEKLRGRNQYESRRDSRRPAAVPRIDDTAAFPSLA